MCKLVLAEMDLQEGNIDKAVYDQIVHKKSGTMGIITSKAGPFYILFLITSHAVFLGAKP